MGSIYKRGKVHWVKYYRNGKPYRESTKSHKEADAKRLLKKREGEISEGKLPGIYFDRVTFDELAEDFLRDYRINQKKSLKRAEYSVNHLNDYFEGIKEDHFIFGIAPEHGWLVRHGHPGRYGREDGRAFLAHLPSGPRRGCIIDWTSKRPGQSLFGSIFLSWRLSLRPIGFQTRLTDL